jgi:hypothetical protein
MCGKGNVSLGAGSVAPIYQPLNVNQAVQSVPVFKATGMYEKAPFNDGLLNYHGCNGNYPAAGVAYHQELDKNGNQLPQASYNTQGQCSGDCYVKMVAMKQ